MQTEAPWHEHFFDGAWRQAQPHSFSPEQTRDCAEALRELLQLAPGARVLDVPCGDGRIADHFARWGYRVRGIDRSPHFLELARARPAADSAEYVQGDMWKDDFGCEEFDAALSIWSSIGYASEAEDRAYFGHLHRALRPGGGLVVDTQSLETVVSDFQERGWYRAGEILVAEERRFDALASRVESLWCFAGPEGEESCRTSLRIYSVSELVSLLREIGFVDFEAYGSMDLEEFSVHSSRLVLTARKAED